MITAYLRDPLLLPPDYKNGIRSILRQKVILDNLELDGARENMENDLELYRQLLVACKDKQQRSEIVHSYEQVTALVRMLRDRNVKGARMLSPESRTQKMKNVYEVLKESKLVENEARTFTDEEFYEIMDRMKQKEAEQEASEETPIP